MIYPTATHRPQLRQSLKKKQDILSFQNVLFLLYNISIILHFIHFLAILGIFFAFLFVLS